MAFEGTEPTVISVCVDCVYFIAYGRLDDQTMDANPDAGREHAAKMAAQWGDAEITPGCGSDCPERGPVESRGDTDTWFSSSACEGCGSRLGGDREHATAWVKAS